MKDITKKEAQAIVADILGGIKAMMIYPGSMSENDQMLLTAIDEAVRMLGNYIDGSGEKL